MQRFSCTRKICQHKPYIFTEVRKSRIQSQLNHQTLCCGTRVVRFVHSSVHVNVFCAVNNTASKELYAGNLYDNIGLVLAYLPSGATYVTASASFHEPAILILSPVLFMHVGHPYITFVDLRNLCQHKPYNIVAEVPSIGFFLGINVYILHVHP